MIDVVIAGIGQTPVGEHWDISLRDLALDAIQAALKDAGGLKPQALFVGNMLAPNLSNQAHLGALIADYAGLTGIEAITLEASGASGAAALRQGYLAVASGMVDIALIVGVEKFTDKSGAEIEEAIATETDLGFRSHAGAHHHRPSRAFDETLYARVQCPREWVCGLRACRPCQRRGK